MNQKGIMIRYIYTLIGKQSLEEEWNLCSMMDDSHYF